jgi:hypothetical protein
MTAKVIADLWQQRHRRNNKAIVYMLIDSARDHIDGQAQDANASDAKALGLLAANLAIVAVLITFHGSLGPKWWLPGLLLSASALLHFASVYPRDFDTGPNWRWVYDNYGGGASLAAGQVVLSELLEAIDANDREGFLGKDNLFMVGLWLMVIGLIASGIAAYVR